ncbi:MAG: EAL domain-containing protein [Myxococcales bacterium]|nr:EAL domain-containing protein [Myxococcales bacterium]MDD9968305.1 EAL domain-containing protein [Myxococcales bacterium]
MDSQAAVAAPSPGEGRGPARVLVVDDMPAVVRAFQRILQACGYQVEAVSDGAEAVECVRSNRYDAVLSDISMPGTDGLELLKVIREQDMEVPVILVTGDPSVETAIPAVEYGALSYLVKPVSPDTLRKKVGWAVHLHQLARMKREAFRVLGEVSQSDAEKAELGAVYDSALEKLKIFYQPIVRWSERTVAGYEALVRSGEPEMPSPGHLFEAGERLNRTVELNRRIRVMAPGPMADDPSRGLLFFNLHVLDLNDETLVDPNSPLVAIADRVVLEVTERASLDQVPAVRSRVAQLRELGFRIAVDDLGAGYAGLSSFALLEPDVVKLDMALVRDVHKEATKQRLVRSMTQLCADMGLEVVAEGVECEEECQVLVELGADLLQGYYFAKPAPAFIDVDFQ